MPSQTLDNIRVSVADGEHALSVRAVSLEEGLSELFCIHVTAVSEDASIPLDPVVDRAASMAVEFPFEEGTDTRYWHGVCESFALTKAEPDGASTYQLTIVPTLARLAHGRDNRIFQHLSIPEIVDIILAAWNVTCRWEVDRERCPTLEYRVQFDESDYAFICRLLEEAAISYALSSNANECTVVLSDAPHQAAPHPSSPMPFVREAMLETGRPYVDRVQLKRSFRPGAVAYADYDFRNPSFRNVSRAVEPGADPQLERYGYLPGVALIETDGGDTPVADDKGAARRVAIEGDRRAASALAGLRSNSRSLTFATNLLSLAPGTTLSIADHPSADLDGSKWLVTTLRFRTDDMGSHGEWSTECAAVTASAPYCPAPTTPRPRISSVHTAIVVGPAGSEIHTDEFGRIRVAFPWDREAAGDDNSSCWMRVSRGWAGAGYGLFTVPRVGLEVLVGFVGGNPDQPIVVGCVHNAAQPVPYKLPQHKTRSTWRSQSSPASDGFNEIMLEDAAGDELVYIQAENNLTKLVKNDEATTVGRDRAKDVAGDESERVGGNRSENVEANRNESTGGQRGIVTKGNHTLTVGASYSRFVDADATERTEGSVKIQVAGERQLIVKKASRRLYQADDHLHVKGARMIAVDGGVSRAVHEDVQEKIGGALLLETGDEIHLSAAGNVVIDVTETASSISLVAAGGFIHIDQEGVTIEGKLVKINSGGAAEGGAVPDPTAPTDPEELSDDEAAGNTDTTSEDAA